LAALRQLPRLALERAQPSSSAPDSPRHPIGDSGGCELFVSSLARRGWRDQKRCVRLHRPPALIHRRRLAGTAVEAAPRTTRTRHQRLSQSIVTHKAGSRLSSLSPLQSSQAPAVFMQRLGTPSTPHPPNRVQNSPRVREKRVVGRALASSKNHREVGFLDN
jgi:hypothetical protein